MALLAHWPLRENLLDISGNSKHLAGTCTHKMDYASGELVTYLNGVDDKLYSTIIIEPNKSYTIAADIFLTSNSYRKCMIGAYGAIGLKNNSSSGNTKICLVSWANDMFIERSVDIYNWQRYICHFDHVNSKKRVYLNNTLLMESDFSIDKWELDRGRRLSIGGYFEGTLESTFGEDFCEMYIKDVKIYDDINLNDLKEIKKLSRVERKPIINCLLSDHNHVEQNLNSVVYANKLWYLQNDLFPESALGNTNNTAAFNDSIFTINTNSYLTGRVMKFFTLSFWFRADDRTMTSNLENMLVESYISEESKHFRVFLTRDNHLFVHLSNNAELSSKITIESKKWYHVAIISKHNRLEIYINGNYENGRVVDYAVSGAECFKIGSRVSLFSTDGSYDPPGAVANNNYQFYGMIKNFELYEYSMRQDELQEEVRKYLIGKCKNEYTLAHYPLDGSLRNLKNPSKPMRTINTEIFDSGLSKSVYFDYGTSPLGKCLCYQDKPVFSELFFNQWPESEYILDYDKPLSFSLWMHKENKPSATAPDNGVIFNFFRNSGGWPNVDGGGIWISSDKNNCVSVVTPSFSGLSKPILETDKWCFYYFYLEREVGLHIYIDGVLRDTIKFDSTGDRLSGRYQTFIGGLHGTFYSRYSNYKFYNRRLTYDEIYKEMDTLVFSMTANPNYEKQRNLFSDLFKDDEADVMEGNPDRWDPSLHRYALTVRDLNWESGQNGGVAEPTKGYHAVTYRNNGTIYVTYRNINSTIDPAIAYRWLGVCYFCTADNKDKTVLKSGCYYTVSMDILSDNPLASVSTGLYSSTTSDGNLGFRSKLSEPIPIEKVNEWHRVSYTFKTIGDLGPYYALYIYGYECAEGTILIKNVSLTEGMRPTNSLVFKKITEERTESLYNLLVYTDNTPIINPKTNSFIFRNRDEQSNFLEVSGMRHPEIFTYTLWLKTRWDGYVVFGVEMSTQTEGLAVTREGKLAWRSWRSVNNEDVYDRTFAVSSVTVNDGKWHHVVVTYDKKDLKIYVDGKLSGNATINVDFKYVYAHGITNKCRFGANGGMLPGSNFYSRAFQGEIKNFKVYGNSWKAGRIAMEADKFRTLTITKEHNIVYNTDTVELIEKSDDFLKTHSYQNAVDYKLTKLSKDSWIQVAKRNDAYTMYFFSERSILPSETVTVIFDVLPLRTIDNTSSDLDMFFFDQEYYNVAGHFNIGGFKEGEERHIEQSWRNPTLYTIRFFRFDVNVDKEIYLIKNIRVIHNDTKLIEYKQKEKIYKGIDCNLLGLKDWKKVLSGTVGNFKHLHSLGDDPGKRIMIENPWGELDIAWVNMYNSASEDGDGGWDCIIPFSNTDFISRYVMRFSVWVRVENLINFQSDHNKIWFGCMNYSPAEIVHIDGTVNENPYFIIDNYTNIVNKWVLFVSYIFPNNWDQNTADAFNSRMNPGVYDIGGAKIGNASTFKFNTNTTRLKHRAYLYYATDPTVHVYFYKPRIDFIGLNEPTMGDLINGNDGSLVKDDGVPDDVYFIETKYDEQGIKWGKIFYHKPLGGSVLVNSIREMLRCTTENLKSCIYLLDGCRDEDNNFEFKMEYEGLPGVNRWKQNNNPIYSNVVEKYTPISISWENADGYPFTGLANPKDDYGNSFLCGSTGGGWWWSVGARAKYSLESTGIPGPYSGANFTSLSLWVKLIDKHVTIGKNKIIARDVIYE